MNRKIFHMSTPVVGMLILFVSVTLTAQTKAPQVTVNHPTFSGVSLPVTELAKLPEALHYGFHEANPVHRIPMRPAAAVLDRVEQKTTNGGVNYSVGVNFLGLGNGYPGYSDQTHLPTPTWPWATPRLSST